MRGKTDSEKALRVLCHLKDATFDFHYESFAQEGPFTEDAERNGIVKEKVLAEFKKDKKSE